MQTFPSLFAFVLGVSVAAQTTHVVGAGAHATIDDALASAAPGDVVLVQPGSYPPLHATIGVTIRAATSGTVVVAVGSTVQSQGPVHLLGLELHTLGVTGSTCSLDQCTVVSDAYVNGSCLAVTAGTLHLLDCVVGRPAHASQVWPVYNHGIFAQNSTVTAVDTSIRGRDAATYFAYYGGTAVYLSQQSRFHAVRCTLRGGDVYSATYLPGPALDSDGMSPAWIADSTLIGGAQTAGGAPAACPVASATGRFARCTFLPAACPPPSLPLNGPLLAVHRPAPPQAGAPFQLVFTAEPNEFIGVFASFALARTTFPELEQPVALHLGSLFALDVLAADGLGHATGTWTLPPGTADLALWLQGVTPGALPLQLSPVTGGVIR